MNLQRGDVVLVPFPQDPHQPPRRRPALVVQSDHNNARLANAIFVMITSLADREATQVLIDLVTPEGQQSGLAHTSAVKCENIHPLPKASVIRVLGSLPDTLMQQVNVALVASLALP